MNDSCCSKPERCYTGMLERPRYFPRKLITDTEMTLDQEYVRNRLRMHNRMLHGWGVVCGALVRKAAKDKLWTVVVEKGFLLGPYGDDILIDCDREINLKSFGMSAVTGEPCPQAVDPWCSDVSVPREPGTYYVAVKYQQIKARPVPTQPVGCGCDDTECEYSRWRDGYCIGILDDCPTSHEVDPPEIDDLFQGKNPVCPECPDEPWVVLAEVTVDRNGKIESIDNCHCRRIVASFGNFWWRCQEKDRQRLVDKKELERIRGYQGVDHVKNFEIAEILHNDEVVVRLRDAFGKAESVMADEWLAAGRTPSGRELIAKRANVNAQEVQRWVARVDLMRLVRVGEGKMDIEPADAELLESALTELNISSSSSGLATLDDSNDAVKPLRQVITKIHGSEHPKFRTLKQLREIVNAAKKLEPIVE